MISKLKRSNVQLLDLFMDEFRRAGAPGNVLQALQTTKRSALEREATWFNHAKNFLTATGETPPPPHKPSAPHL